MISAPAARSASSCERCGGPRHDHDQRHLGRRAHELAVRAAAAPRSRTRRASAGASASAVRAVSSGSSASAVPMPTQIASTSRAPAVHEAAALLAGDPLRVAGLGRDLAVEAHRRLEDHVAGGRCARACETAGSAAARCARCRRPRPARRRPRRAGCRARGRTPSSVGSSEATTTRSMPAFTIASVQGGVWPWWQQGSSVTYIVAPIGSMLAGRERRHLGVRARRRRRGSPRRAPRRRARSRRPTSGFGLVCPRPCSASSIALPCAACLALSIRAPSRRFYSARSESVPAAMRDAEISRCSAFVPAGAARRR